jgi:hypothetical protein
MFRIAITWLVLSLLGNTDANGETTVSPAFVEQPPALFVDSRNGSDLNSGFSSLEALQTLASAIGLAEAHQQFYLAKGSYWRESFDLSDINSPKVDVYGEGEPPIIDGSDVVTGWSRVGATNIHEASFTFEEGGRWVVYEDGVMLKRIVDPYYPPALTQAQLEALCDATPGSFVDGVGGVDGTPMVGSGQIQIHASTSDDPETNGKVYSISRRTYCIVARDNAVIRGVQTMRAISNNGSIDLVNTLNGRIEQCLALDGTKHSIGFGSGHAKDSITIRNDRATHYDQSNTPFVAYLNDGTGSSALIERCGVVGPGNGVDIFSHGAPNPLDTFTARQLWFIDNSDMYAGGASYLTGCYYRNVLNIPSETGELSMVMANLNMDAAVSGLGIYGGVRMTNCAIKVQSRGDGSSGNNSEVFRIRGATGPQIISHCAFYMEEPRPQLINNTSWFANFDSTQDLTFEFCVVVNGVNLMQMAPDGSYTGDFNVFMANNKWSPSDTVIFQHPSGYKNTLASWQAATGQDTYSVYLDFNDQESGNPNAFWLGVANNENDGPNDGDFRINPLARVYDSSNVVHIGTFADGTTPITDAGPQQHWDWNLRTGSAGPPERWPYVPDTLAKAKEYVSAPEAWDFYPVQTPDITVSVEASEIADGETYDLGSVSVGGSESVTFAIRNIGHLDLILFGDPKVVVTGPDAEMVRVLTDPASPVGALTGITTFDVQFLPTRPGPVHAALAIANNSPDKSNFHISLAGYGVIPISDWRQIYFGSPENTGIGSDLYDHDKDGIPNLIEYAFGLNPILDSAGELPQWQINDDNFVMKFTEPDGMTGITYGAEWSSNMAQDGWQPIANSGMKPLHIFSVPAGIGDRLFLRVKVTIP